MNAEKFLEVCESLGLKVKLNDDGGIAFTGEASLITAAQNRLKRFQDLMQSVTAILRERAAKEQAQAEPQAQERERQAEPVIKVNWLLPQDAQAACVAALQGLTDATRAKLKNFIMACRRRGINIYYDTTSSGGQRVFLEPVNGDISDLFTWIHGWAECALLVYLGTQDKELAKKLSMFAAGADCDLFTAGYLIARMRRDLYFFTCADWKFKPIEAGIERLKTKCAELKIFYGIGYDEDWKLRVCFSTCETNSVDDMVAFSVRLPCNPPLERAFYDYIKNSKQPDALTTKGR